ncbi:uncharacterized protein LOC110839862 isoform X2 [Zootermopsis nevadensis]|uniref:uncharacterized protein LOC110839862 isoform X2 n=1 Tax=Zootermopsis nevadensis TaxID=136037 RepID=UPI000B8ECAE8|nr:uncharacterized protein LOC110839862 isoform X2 [Zootermopsis nevadensis]
MSVQVEAAPSRLDKTALRRQRNKMSIKRKRTTPPSSQQLKNLQSNGLYVHSSPPRVLQVNPSIIRQWLRSGDLEKLESVVLEGQGHKLVGEYSPDPKVRAYIKTVPTLMAKIEMLHEAATKDQLGDMETMLQEEKSKRMALCKDSAGVPLLHKAVYYDHQDMVRWLVENYPLTVSTKDKDGRTALFYCCVLKDPKATWELLETAGADPSATDSQARIAAYYIEHPNEIDMPDTRDLSGSFRRFTSGKNGLVVTRANIRIWIHDRDLGRLQQMLWEGHGGKLRVETSNSPRVKRFLDAVPYIMGTIKDVHAAVVNDDKETFQKRTADPVPNQIFISKDQNGLNPLHKAAGLGREEMVEGILQRSPSAALATDNEGRLPLHYAAAVKDGGHIYNLLVEAGANENALDNRGKPPSYYRTKPGELDLKNLQVIPDAPRTATIFPPAWDWRLLNNMTYDFGPVPVDSDMKYNEDKPPERKQKSVSNMAGAAVAAATEIRAEIPEVATDVSQLSNGIVTPTEGHKGAEPLGDEDEGVGEESDHDEDYRGQMEEEEKEAAKTDHEDQQTDNEGEGEDYGDGTGEAIDRWERQDDEMEAAGEEDAGMGEEEEEEEARPESEEVTEVTHKDVDVEPAEEDEEVKQLVEEGNMEQLANLVLNGEGHRLIGQTSDDPELQGFLNNVPAYMAKIRAVHEAAQEGNLRDLQAALDRRKFAIARDGSNSMGTTPLHVATLFGHTAIIRYLGSRFPETLHARDGNDRTPLHYAATMADNGHFYNLLLNLGADPALKDNQDNTAEYYLKNTGILTHQDLLEQYGASGEDANNMLEDKVPNDTVSARRDIDDPEILEALERCYELVREETSTNGQLMSGTLLQRYLKRPVFEKLKMRLTRMDHNLLDVIWPGAKEVPEDNDDDLDEELEEVIQRNGGVLIPDYESYTVFAELLMPLIKDLHGLLVSYDLNPQPKSMFFLAEEGEDEDEDEIRKKKGSIGEIITDPSGKQVKSGRIECCRNVAEYQIPSGLSFAQLEALERDLVSALKDCDQGQTGDNDDDDEEKSYYSIAEVLEDNSEVKDKLEASNLLVLLTDEHENEENLLHGQHWPHGRGVFITKDGNMAIWINVQEHLRIVSSTPKDNPSSLGEAYDRLAHLIMDLETMFEFKTDLLLGNLTACPSVLGNTLHIYLTAHLPKLGQEKDKLKHLCSVRGLNIKKKSKEEDMFNIWNQQSLSITEHQTLKDFSIAASNIVQLESNHSKKSKK